MTRARNDNHSTEFGLWLRVQTEIDSKCGYSATNLDYIWRNYQTGDWMLIEEKRHKAELTFAQQESFDVIDRICSMDPSYRGFHLIQFEKTSPADGLIYLDGQEISRGELIDFLQFREVVELPF